MLAVYMLIPHEAIGCSAINIAGPLQTLRLYHQRSQLPPLPLYWLQLCKAASVTCRSTNNHYKPKYSLPSNVANLHHLSLSSFAYSTYTNTAGAVVLRNKSRFWFSSHFDILSIYRHQASVMCMKIYGQFDLHDAYNYHSMKCIMHVTFNVPPVHVFDDVYLYFMLLWNNVDSRGS